MKPARDGRTASDASFFWPDIDAHHVAIELPGQGSGRSAYPRLLSGHATTTNAAAASGGAGITLWFEAEHRERLDELIAQARRAGAAFLGELQWNPKAHHHEATVLDPDGYVLVLHSPFEPD